MSNERGPDQGRVFLNMSGGILALVLAGAIMLPLVCCLGAVILGAGTDGH